MNWHVKRAGQALITLWVVVSISFLLTRMLPYNAVDILANEEFSGDSSRTYEEVREDVASRMMIDPSAGHGEAYVQYMSSLLQGDLGPSVSQREGEPVSSIIADSLPWTLLVMGMAITGMFALSLTLGALMAYKEQSRFDYANTGVAIVATSIPYYVAGLLLIKYVGYGDFLIFDWFPHRNRIPSDVEPGLNLAYIGGALRHALLPAMSWILTAYGAMAVAMRGNSIQVLGEDYVRVAELRGLPSRRIALRYVGRNAILPLYTSLLITVGAMFGASVVLERIFAYKGVGFWLLPAIQDGNLPLMMGVFLVITVSLVLAVWIADVTYGFIDPRITTGDEGEAY